MKMNVFFNMIVILSAIMKVKGSLLIVRRKLIVKIKVVKQNIITRM